MSFLNQLKSQAKALQSERVSEQQGLEERTAATEQAGKLVLFYLQDLARQLSVIQPAGPQFTLDGRTPWPAMKLVDFRVDARRKMLRNREVIDYIAMGWQVVPQIGGAVSGLVAVNFPTEMRRVEDRLAMGPVKHERREIRKPDNSALLEVRYEYLTQTRGSVVATLDHDHGMVHWRLLNTAGFEIVQTTWPSTRIQQPLMDELAKRLVGQPNNFV
ncbi:MAG: hypothetical protein K0R89_2334 [Ramlibacter sp.]|jgi:hypothetical protein|nr:hypothetical protein [Ramlibacter sp.]